MRRQVQQYDVHVDTTTVRARVLVVQNTSRTPLPPNIKTKAAEVGCELPSTAASNLHCPHTAKSADIDLMIEPTDRSATMYQVHRIKHGFGEEIAEFE